MDSSHYNALIDQDTDVHDIHGELLIRFRKGAVNAVMLKAGVESFKNSVTLTDGRGIASGSSHKRVLKDGTVSKITVGNKVTSGNVGYMDPAAHTPICRLTDFGRRHFAKYQQGIPFVQHIDQLYAKLCPQHYARQRQMADATNRNYVIPHTAFTTVTVNLNFRTATHKDSGDFMQGMGNLIVWNDGSYTGGYFVLPQYRIAVDCQPGDALFVDVHQWHGNTPMQLKPGFDQITRYSFVLYYRHNMIKCQQPSEQLKQVKQQKTGYYRLLK